MTECVECDRPLMVGLSAGRFAPLECEDCGATNIIEMTRMDGTTYSEAHFLEEVLPDLEDVERIDHPTEDVYVYGDPEVTKPDV